MKIYFIYENELVEDTLNNEASLRNECIEIFFFWSYIINTRKVMVGHVYIPHASINFKKCEKREKQLFKSSLSLSVNHFL